MEITDPTSKDSPSSNLVLYSYWQSSCSWRTRFALNLKSIPFEYRAVNLPKGEQFNPEFLKLNPLGYVPLLLDGDIVISDSLAILLYLEERYPEKNLLPSDPAQRALNLQISSIVCSSIQPLHMNSLLALVDEKFGPGLSWANHHIEKGFIALETLLSRTAGKFAIGETLCMADVFLAPQLAVTASRFKVDMLKFPTLTRLYETYNAVPEFLAASPEQQPDANSW